MKSPFTPLLIAAFSLIALWIMAMHGYAAIPTDTSRLVALLLASGVLGVNGFVKAKAKRYFQVTCVWSLALACWAFYAERVFLLEGINDPRIVHAVTVYNLFRYTLLLICLIIFIRDTIKALRELNS